MNLSRAMHVFLVILLFAAFAKAQTAAEYFQQANEAYEKKDYVSNVRLLEKSIEAGADHPMIFYFLARGYALTGNRDAAVLWLNKIADLGVFLQPEADEKFASIHKSRKFETVVKRFQDNLKPTDSSKPAITMKDKDLVPEGIAYDPADQRFYFGGAARPEIVAYKDGKFEKFSKPEDGLWSALGMKIDSRTRTLWVASSALAGEEKGKSGVFQYDLKERKLTAKYLLPDGNHGLGEVVVDSKGNVYATDSVSPAIYFLNKGKLELLLGPEPFRSPQGACLSPDEKILFVADYSRGIFAVDLETKKYWKLARADKTTTVAGIDGLYLHKKDLVAIQNGVQPNRVLKIELSADHTKMERVDILESNHRLFPEPTLGVVVENDFYYIGNSMIGPFLENPKVELKPAAILKLPLEKKPPSRQERQGYN
ncbi:SMP-30/gluconolactonase/LRE family protein [bacterium]|nr:SMP-30/gluconolactonase/LRE family protein [bacterium]